MNYKEMLGEKIRRAREEKNINQEDLGKVIGVDKQTISKIEKGKRNIHLEEFFKLIKFLEKDEKYFSNFEEFLFKPDDSTIIFLINRLSHFKPFQDKKQIEIKEVVKFFKEYLKKENIGMIEISDITYILNKSIDLKGLYEDLKLVNDYLSKKGLTKEEVVQFWD